MYSLSKFPVFNTVLLIIVLIPSGRPQTYSSYVTAPLFPLASISPFALPPCLPVQLSASFKIPHVSETMQFFFFLCLSDFTEHDALQFYLCSHKRQDLHLSQTVCVFLKEEPQRLCKPHASHNLGFYGLSHEPLLYGLFASKACLRVVAFRSQN